MRHHILVLLLLCVSIGSYAQIGEYRNRFAVGVTGGYNLTTMGFQPKVVQDMKGGISAGLVGRYTTEKYFSTLCAIQIEANIAQMGWKERIETAANKPVINPATGVAEEYERTITYIQIPMLAHLSWGHEQRGVNAFVNLGPQIGVMLGEKTRQNYTTPYVNSTDGRINPTVRQENMPVENKFDYGIAVGAGIEAHIKHVGRFNLEGRYYYGLGNIYGDSKRDYFAASNFNTIYIRFAYLLDLR